jgi:hypothetical protein
MTEGSMGITKRSVGMTEGGEFVHNILNKKGFLI